MCLIVLARDHHPRYPLVVVANRDEYHARPTRRAHWWSQPPGLLAGRDLQAEGTWMGVTTGGRWAAVTNYREGSGEPAARSRGDLPVDFLAGGQNPATFLAEVDDRARLYNGFSLLVGDARQVHYYSNRAPGRQVVPPGIHTLSNHLLDTPWPKAEAARLKLEYALHEPAPALESLLAVLGDSRPFEDHELPVTGVGPELERVLSPPFIVGEDYGTRSTTVLLFDREGGVLFAEQGFRPGGRRDGLVLHEFRAGDPAPAP